MQSPVGEDVSATIADAGATGAVQALEGAVFLHEVFHGHPEEGLAQLLHTMKVVHTMKRRGAVRIGNNLINASRAGNQNTTDIDDKRPHPLVRRDLPQKITYVGDREIGGKHDLGRTRPRIGLGGRHAQGVTAGVRIRPEPSDVAVCRNCVLPPRPDMRVVLLGLVLADECCILLVNDIIDFLARCELSLWRGKRWARLGRLRLAGWPGGGQVLRPEAVGQAVLPAPLLVKALVSHEGAAAVANVEVVHERKPLGDLLPQDLEAPAHKIRRPSTAVGCVKVQLYGQCRPSHVCFDPMVCQFQAAVLQ
mmetsp:Transcript_129739/g.361407  ORF Transcript_129739/g.361407 Transcript_129739/m.361407 type:complete len:307 (-) Transcript_129739:336-1256(-)